MRYALIAVGLLLVGGAKADYCWMDGTPGTVSDAPPSGECAVGWTLYSGAACWDDAGDRWLGVWGPDGPRCQSAGELLAAAQDQCRATLRQTYAARWSDPTLGYSALDVAAAGQFPLPDRLACYTADIAIFDAALGADLSAVAGMDLATARQCAPGSLPVARKDEEAAPCLPE